MKTKKYIVLVTYFLMTLIDARAELECVRSSILKNFPAHITLQKTVIDEKTKRVSFPAFSMSEYEKHNALFNLLDNTSAPQKALNDSIDQKTVDDLYLFFFSQDKQSYSILETLYRGRSINGKIALARMLVNPTTSQTILTQKQAVLSYLLNNHSCTQTLIALFDKLRACEESLYSLWNSNDLLYSEQVKKTFYRGSFKKYQNKGGKHWLEFHRQRLLFTPLVNVLRNDLLIGGVITAGIAKEKNAFTPKTLIPSVPLSLYFLAKKIAGSPSNASQFATYPAHLASTLVASGVEAIFTIPEWLGTMRSYKEFVTYVRKRFEPLVTCSMVIKEIYTELTKHPILMSACDPGYSLRYFMAGENTEQKNLMDTLAKPVFKTTSTALHQPLGTVLHAIPLFLAAKQSFKNVFQAIGACEALISTALFFKEKEGTRMPWCFASYTEAERPYIQLTHYAHPLISADKVVHNSLELGKTYQGLIVTGPNKSGKSISIRAIMLCVLLAQTLGICPAQQATVTPMSKILSYLNPVDNIAEGKSLFQAETERIKKIVDDAYALPASEFSFIVADELLSGTAPIEGEAATWGIAYGLAQLPNCMPIMATHFAKLTSLPAHTHNFFANYHVSAIKNPDGSFTHPFKLEPGRSHQVIALDLARASGFDEDLMNSADAFLERKGFKRGRTL
jgi:hypothetical protein